MPLSTWLNATNGVVILTLCIGMVSIIIASIALTRNPNSATNSMLEHGSQGDLYVTTEHARSIIFAQRTSNLEKVVALDSAALDSAAKPIEITPPSNSPITTSTKSLVPNEVGRFDSDGKFGVNTSGPLAWQHIESSEDKYPHLRLASDPNNYADMRTDADGVLHISTVAGALNIDEHRVESSVWPFVTEMDQAVGSTNDVEFNSISVGNSSSLLSTDTHGGLILKSAQSYIVLNNVNISTNALQNVRTLDQSLSMNSDTIFRSTTLNDQNGHIASLTVNASNQLCVNGIALSASNLNFNPLNLNMRGGVLDTVQNIDPGTSPTFAGITLTGLSGILKVGSLGSIVGQSTTDDLIEGTNKFFSTALAQQAFTGASPISIINGLITVHYSSNLKLAAGGLLDTAQDISTNSRPRFAGLSISGISGILSATPDGVISTESVSTDSLSEGKTNFYCTQDRLQTFLQGAYTHTNLHLTDSKLDTIQDISTTSLPQFAGLLITGLEGVLKASAGQVTASATTDDMSEGANNLYFTQGHVQTFLQGAYHPTNLRLTDSKLNTVQDISTTSSPHFAGLLISGLNGVVKANAGQVTANATTDDMSEGANNLYFTQGRVQSFLQGAYHATNLRLTDSKLNTVQDISTTSGPSFAQLFITGLLNPNGVLKAKGGQVTTGVSTDDVKEGLSNLYYTEDRVRSVIQSYIITPKIGSSAQSVGTTDSPTFAGLTLTGLSGILKSTNGVISATNITTADVQEGGDKLYFRNTLVHSALRQTNPISVSDGYIGLNYINTSFKLTAGGALDTIQSIDTSATPVFAGLSLTGYSGILKASNTGLISAGGVSTDDFIEGSSNLFFRTARAQSAISSTSPISYSNGTMGLNYSTVNLQLTNGTLDTVQDISTNATPTFGGLKLGSSSGFLKASNGTVSAETVTTDDVKEGKTNLFFTTQKAQSAVASTSPISYSNGTIGLNYSTVNLQLNYGTLDTVQDISTNANPTFSGLKLGSYSGFLKASNGTISAETVTTDDVNEGKTNLFFTTQKAQSAIASTSPISYSNGTIGLNYNTMNMKLTDGAIDTVQNIATTASPTFAGLKVGSYSGVLSATSGVISTMALTTADVSEPTEGKNLYFTDTRARNSLNAGTGITYDKTTGVIANSITTTTDLTEGTNLYYTDTKARSALNAGTGIDYNSSTGTISATGVSSVTGTENQITANASTGSITLSLPQSINTTASPQFSTLGIGSAPVAGYGLNISVPTGSATNYGLYMFNTSAYTSSNDVGLWLNNTFTPSTTGASIISSKCTPAFNTSSGVVITAATGFDSSPSFNAGIGSSTYTTVYGISTNPVLTITATTPLTVNNIRSLYLNPVANLSGAAHLVNSMVGLYVNSGSANLSNSSTLSVGYNIYLNAYSTGTFNYGLYVTGNYTKNNDQGLRLINTYTPTTNASGLYQARITPTFNASAGLTHSAYALDLTPNFNTSTTGTYTTVYGQNISPVINASGVTAVTITAMRGLSITPSINMSNAAHVLTNLNGIYVDVPSTNLGTGSITNSYGAYINVSSVATTNHGIFITGNFTKSSDLAFRLGSNITPASSAATLYQTRLQGQFISSTGLTHSNAYGIDVNPTFVSTGTGTFTTLHAQNISPVVNASGVSPILIATLKGINVTPTLNLSNAAHTLGNYYGIYVDSGTVNLGTGSITNAYGGYFKTPTGTNTSALYADTISCGNGGVTVPSSTILYVSPTIPKTSAGTLAAVRIAGGTCSVTQNTTSEMAMVFANATLTVSGTGTGTSVASYIGKCNSSVQVGGTITQMADFIAKGTLTYTAGTLTGAY